MKRHFQFEFNLYCKILNQIQRNQKFLYQTKYKMNVVHWNKYLSLFKNMYLQILFLNIKILEIYTLRVS